LKEVVVSWVLDKRKSTEKYLKAMEHEIVEIFVNNEEGILREEEKSRLA
jgi:hypothetical protein